MSRLDRQDWQCVVFRKELFEKEIVTRSKWYNKMGRELIDHHLENLQLRPQKKSSPPAPRPKSVEVVPQVPVSSTFQSKQQMELMAKALVSQQNEDVGRSTYADGVDTHMKAMLYRGLSHENEGRKAYLKIRNRLPPTQRYGGHPPLTLWEHGWFHEIFPHHPLPVSTVPLNHSLGRMYRANGVFENQDVIAWPTGDRARLKPYER